MITEEELREIIGFVTIEGKRINKEVKSKTELAKKIVNDTKFKTKINPRTLVNYHNYFFGDSDQLTYPNDDTISSLLAYINCQNLKNFRENKPAYKDYPDSVPFAINNKDIVIDVTETKIEVNNLEKNSLKNEPVDIKQTSILSLFNHSLIKHIKGKIRQLDILGFGNKKEIVNDKSQIKK